jgi:hypothetical protein
MLCTLSFTRETFFEHFGQVGSRFLMKCNAASRMGGQSSGQTDRHDGPICMFLS